MRWLDGITDAMDMNLVKLWEMVRDREAWHEGPWGCKEYHRTGQLNSSDKIVCIGSYLGELRELVDGQGGLACCGSWGRKESDTTERLI